MAAYCRVYDSRHQQADCQEPGSAPEPYTLGNQVWATLPFLRARRVVKNRKQTNHCDVVCWTQVSSAQMLYSAERLFSSIVSYQITNHFAAVKRTCLQSRSEISSTQPPRAAVWTRLPAAQFITTISAFLWRYEPVRRTGKSDDWLTIFCSHNKVHCSEIPIVLSNLLYHYFFHWNMAHFNFVISQNAKWGHAGFYINCHRMTVPENILLQKKHWPRQNVSAYTLDIISWCS